MYVIYRITTPHGFTYIGVTGNLKSRKANHRFNAKRGYLGDFVIIPTRELMFGVIATAEVKSDALIIEARMIAEEILKNPHRCCNKSVGKANPY